MSDVTPWVAIYAAIVSTGAAVWQIANYALTGGRTKVQLRIGAMNGQNMITSRPSALRRDWMENLASQGYTRPVVAVRVANVGRQPVTVTSWGIKTLAGISAHPLGDSIGKPLPHRLEVGESETWAVDISAVAALREGTKAIGGDATVVGIVELADGRTKTSPDRMS